MAEKTKGTAKTAVKKVVMGSCESFRLVRIALDSVQFNALNYYVAGKTDAEKEARAKRIADIMREANAKIEALRSVASNCPFKCDGFCVPYECP